VNGTVDSASVSLASVIANKVGELCFIQYQ
jgi:hypothetical protein